MSLYDNFIEWLDSIELAKSTKDQYRSGISKVDEISKKNDLESVFNWSIDDWETKQKKLLQTPEMFADSKKANPPGGGSFSASLSQLKKFIQNKQEGGSNQEYIITTPKNNYSNYRWYWASSLPSLDFNRLDIISGVTKVIGKIGGTAKYNDEFKSNLKELEINLQLQPKKLSKSESDNSKNVIASAREYWQGTGLLNSDNSLTELGTRVANETINEEQLGLEIIRNVKLPNPNLPNRYTPKIISKWKEFNLEISPLKLIIEILIELFYNHDNGTESYISENELVNIIIPIAADTPNDINKYCIALINGRNGKLDCKDWPRYSSGGPEDKRLPKEFLVALKYWGYLERVSIQGTDDVRYYLTNKARNAFKKDYEPIESDADVQIDPIPFDIKTFHTDCKSAGLVYKDQLITRFVSSLATKPFVLLSGLSGSGKTKLAQTFAQWLCESHEQYCITPVGADWTNREPLLGYVNALDNKEYILPENRALQLLIRANKNQEKPYFLILDEMNLSHVERYFADFLSVMESKDKFKLHSSESNLNITNGDKFVKSIEVPSTLTWPKNLFVVGTVNIDETTYMFSPKVLDRANTIEFRVSNTDISDFLKKPKNVELETLNGKGIGMAKNFLEIATATKKGKKIKENYQLVDDQDVINNFFVELQKSGAEFGYRTAFEISKLIYKLNEFNLTEENDKLDIAIMQKMLPKLHGSRTKLSRTLKPLAKLCLKDVNDKFDKEYYENFENINFKEDKNIKYKLSFEKIMRMYKNAVENGFASYAEA